MPGQGASDAPNPELSEARVTPVGSERWGSRLAPGSLSRGPGGSEFVAEHTAFSGKLQVFSLCAFKSWREEAFVHRRQAQACADGQSLGACCLVGRAERADLHDEFLSGQEANFPWPSIFRFCGRRMLDVRRQGKTVFLSALSLQ